VRPGRPAARLWDAGTCRTAGPPKLFYERGQVWLATEGKSSWAALHVVERHGGRIEAVVTLEVDVPRSWLRRSRKGLWYCTRDIPPDRIRRLFGFVELARVAG
jgi:hypothetical protein